jgi:hypothetical protein
MGFEAQHERLKQLPDGNDRELYDKLFNVVRHPETGEVLHAQAPMFMSADEIMRTHKLVTEHNGTPRYKLVGEKYDEAFTDPRRTLSGRNYNPGTGTGAGVADSIAQHGYKHNQPIPLGILGVKGSEENEGPTVTNGQHRLSYMWMHHPDTMLPIDADVHQHIFAPGHRDVANGYIKGYYSTSEAKEQLGGV